MKVLGLDMSTKTGFSVVKDTTLTCYGLCIKDSLALGEDKGVYIEDYRFVFEADSIASRVCSLAKEHKPDFIYIEQTNKGRNRTSQKQLEFIHYATLKALQLSGFASKIRYVDTSAWRKILKIRLSKEQSAHNKKVKKKAARGKITTKHLAVDWANKTYNLSLLLKDNDIADAIAVATYGYNYENKSKPNISESDIEKIFLNS